MRRLAPLLAALALAAAPASAEPLYDAVDAYVLYQSDITDMLTVSVTDETHIDQALILAARHDPQRVANGWIAYGALTAAQSPAFVNGVRSRVRSAGRAPVIRQLRRDMAYARNRPPGSAEAIQLILASTAADTTRMTAAGHRYSGIGDAYASLTLHADSSARDRRNANMRALASARRGLNAELAPRVHPAVLGATPLTNADAFGGRRFWDALAGRQSPAPPAFAWREDAAHATTVNRMLTLAALYVVSATESESARVTEMLSERRVTECLAMEQLQLRQCSSVSSTGNEDAHCIARHGLTAPGACFSAILRAG
jgi:hypothetical protein